MEENVNLTGTGEVLKKPQGSRKKTAATVLLVAAVWLGALAALLAANGFTLIIVPNGDSEVAVEFGDEYRDPGARAVLWGKWISYWPKDVQVQMKTDLDLLVLGDYTVTYSVSFLNWQTTAQRTVRVVDNAAPVITLKTTGETFLPGQKYEEEGFIAVDNYDGNVTGRVKRFVKKDVVIYTVQDSSGNSASVERMIPYLDPYPPELTLYGEEYMTIPCGTVFEEPGYTCVDNVEGDMTEDVALEGEVIWFKPGTYTLAYTIADSYGNVTQKLRYVTVEGKPWPDVQWPNGKVIYLTFDDGPSADTLRLLDVLKYYGVKATFFVTGSGNNGELWRMYKEGHSIGIHTMTHDYNSIYASEEAFFNDLHGMQDIIYRNTGVKTTLMRFPGGGSNLVSSYNEGIMTTLTQAVQDAGFQYFDWNVDSNDAGGALRRETVANNVIAGVQKQNVSVVLQHDIHSFSVDAVEDIIVWGLDNGYRFLPLTPSSPPMHHDVLN